MKVSAEITQQLQKDFSDVFNGIGCFDGTSSLQVKPESKPYQVPLTHVVYALQKPLRKKLERLQQQDIIAPLGVDETAEWWNSFMLIPTPNGKVRLCLAPVRLNQVLIRLVHRKPTFNYTFPKLDNVKYLSLIDVSLGYHKLKLDERSPYLTTFACQFDSFRYKRLLFGAAPIGDMFAQK